MAATKSKSAVNEAEVVELPADVVVSDELAVLDPIPETYALTTGLEVKVVDLKTRQFFRLLRILTSGSGSRLATLDLNPNQGFESFAMKLAATILLAIPEAEQEAIDFLISMVEPVGLKEGRKLSPEDRLHNQDLYIQLGEELAANPELEDTLGLIELIVRREAKDIQALGKKVVTMFESAKKMGILGSNESPTVDAS